MLTSRNNWVPTEKFLRDRVNVWQVRAVLRCGQALSRRHRVDLFLRSSLDFGMKSHCEEERVLRKHGLKSRQGQYRSDRNFSHSIRPRCDEEQEHYPLAG